MRRSQDGRPEEAVAGRAPECGWLLGCGTFPGSVWWVWAFLYNLLVFLTFVLNTLLSVLVS